MKIVLTEDYEAMSETAASILFTNILSDNYQNIAITGGTTPQLMYEKLVQKMKNVSTINNTKYYNFDEIPYKNCRREGITISDLRTYFFDPAQIDDDNIHVLDPFNYKKQDQVISNNGGLDLIVIGIGKDGHYCGNLPHTTSFADETTKVIMSEELKIKVGEKHFDTEEEYPDFYVTMGPKSVLNAKEIILIANGQNKSKIIKRVIEGPVNELVPASILKLHPNITFILDKDSASELNNQTIEKYM